MPTMYDRMTEEPYAFGPPPPEQIAFHYGGDVYIMSVMPEPPVVLCVIFLKQIIDNR